MPETPPGSPRRPAPNRPNHAPHTNREALQPADRPASDGPGAGPDSRSSTAPGLQQPALPPVETGDVAPSSHPLSAYQHTHTPSAEPHEPEAGEPSNTVHLAPLQHPSLPADSPAPSAPVAGSADPAEAAAPGLFSNTTDPSARPENPAANLFDRLMDLALRHSQGEPDNERTDAASAASAGAPDQSAPGSAAPSQSPAAAAYYAGGPDETHDNSSAGNIVITVNYMFMDGASEPTPNRTGSLVVTLPNNAQNREPRIILQFVTLATRMAYSALVGNVPKPKAGVTLEKFQSFEVLNVLEVQDQTCSICYDKYEAAETVTTKKRKLRSGLATPLATATPEPRDLAPGATNESNESLKVYLCDHEATFDHAPLQLPCHHVFGRSCLAQWLKTSTSCPLCRLAVAVPPAQSPAHTIPISYITFGNVNEPVGGPEPPAYEPPAAENEDTASSNQRPGLLRRASHLFFNHGSHREAPPAPLYAQPSESRPQSQRNPSFAPVINNIQNYFRRSRRQQESDPRGSGSLFASGVSSRRTSSGVETVTSDASASNEMYENLAPLSGFSDSEHGAGRSEDQDDDQEDQH